MPQLSGSCMNYEHKQMRFSSAFSIVSGAQVPPHRATGQAHYCMGISLVTAYLDIAEVHALNQEPMYMKDWLETIDDYLKMARRDILTTSGHVSHKQAIEKAHVEYDKYKNQQHLLK